MTLTEVIGAKISYAKKFIPISGGSQSGTGTYLATTNELAFSTNSQERMRIDSNGNVGITTDNPDANLQVGSISNTTTNNQIRLAQGNSLNIHPLFTIEQYAQKTWAVALVQGKLLFCKDPADYTQASLLASSKFTLDQNDRVGVGTNTPSTKFQVEGDIAVNGATTATTVGAAGGASALPATPLGYIVVSINGFARKIPYYNA